MPLLLDPQSLLKSHPKGLCLYNEDTPDGCAKSAGQSGRSSKKNKQSQRRPTSSNRSSSSSSSSNGSSRFQIGSAVRARASFKKAIKAGDPVIVLEAFKTIAGYLECQGTTGIVTAILDDGIAVIDFDGIFGTRSGRVAPEDFIKLKIQAAVAAEKYNQLPERVCRYEPGQWRPPTAQALNRDAAVFVPASQSWPPPTQDTPPTAHICTYADGCVVEGQSAGVATDEHGTADYNPPTERSGAYNQSSKQSSNDACPITITSTRIAFKFIDEERWVGGGLPPNGWFTETGEYMRGDRRASTAAAAAWPTPDTTEQQQQQQQQQPSWG